MFEEEAELAAAKSSGGRRERRREGKRRDRENDSRGGRGGRGGRDDDEISEAALIAISCGISISVTSTLFILILCCMKKRRRRHTTADPDTASELSDASPTRYPHRVVSNNDDSEAPQAMAPNQMNYPPNAGFQ